MPLKIPISVVADGRWIGSPRCGSDRGRDSSPFHDFLEKSLTLITVLENYFRYEVQVISSSVFAEVVFSAVSPSQRFRSESPHLKPQIATVGQATSSSNCLERYRLS